MAEKIAFRERPRSLGAWVIGKKHFGRNHDLVAACEVRQGAADDFLGGAIGIGVGRVEKIDAQFNGLTNQRSTLLLGQSPRVVTSLGYSNVMQPKQSLETFKPVEPKFTYFIRLQERLHTRS